MKILVFIVMSFLGAPSWAKMPETIAELPSCISEESVPKDGIYKIRRVAKQTRTMERRIKLRFGINEIRSSGFEVKVEDFVAYSLQVNEIFNALQRLQKELIASDRSAQMKLKFNQIEIHASHLGKEPTLSDDETVLTVYVDEDSLPYFGGGNVVAAVYRFGDCFTQIPLNDIGSIFFDTFGSDKLSNFLLDRGWVYYENLTRDS